MALITWNAADYRTNVGFADDENQKVFGLLNKLAAERLKVANQAEAATSLLVSDVSEDGMNLRLIFRNLSKSNQRIAVEFLKVLEKNQA